MPPLATVFTSGENATLKTYEKGAIIAHFNTDTFSGQRGATLTVTIDKPFYAQVQLHVSGFIRTDVIGTHVLLEAVRRKRIAPEREAIVHLIGMALLLGLMVLITIQDISHPIIPN